MNHNYRISCATIFTFIQLSLPESRDDLEIDENIILSVKTLILNKVLTDFRTDINKLFFEKIYTTYMRNTKNC